MTPSPLPVDVLDSGLDWASFWVGLIAALATAGAVIVAIVQVAHARRDVKVARDDAAAARADAKAESRLRQESERSHLRESARASAERRAERQAISVTADSEWDRFSDGRTISGDFFAFPVVIVRNNSTLPISNVRVWVYVRVTRNDGSVAYPAAEYRRASVLMDNQISRFARPANEPIYVGSMSFGERLVTVIEFTDSYLDRWRLDWNGDLTLLTPRRIDVDQEQEFTWSGRSDVLSDDHPPVARVLPESYSSDR